MADVTLDRPEYREVMQSYAKMALGERAREPDESDDSTPEQWGYDKAWLEGKGVAPAGVVELLDIACGGGCPLAFGERTEGIGSLPDVGGTILDLGCGGGHDCALASNIVGESGRVIGVDLTQEMLDRTAKTVEAFGRSAPLELICTPIDQAASLNLFIPADVEKWDLLMLHYRAWELGIKSLYYLRSKSVQRAGFAGGVEADNTPEAAKYELATTDYDECLACQ